MHAFPLNFLEPSYMAMVDSALGQGRFLGVIQPTSSDDTLQTPSPLYKIGTVCRITSFTEADDGRYLVTIQGVSRFKLVEELDTIDGYRRGRVDFSAFQQDLDMHDEHDFDRTRLTQVLENYFTRH